jgi:hypothetical protein
MSRAAAGLLVLALVGCSGDDAKPDPSTTEAPVENTTTSESVAPLSTVPPATSTPPAVTTDENPGTESIGVTEKITITVTGAEDS